MYQTFKQKRERTNEDVCQYDRRAASPPPRADVVGEKVETHIVVDRFETRSTVDRRPRLLFAEREINTLIDCW